MLVRRNLEFLTKYEPIRKGKIEGVSYIYIYKIVYFEKETERGGARSGERSRLHREEYDDIKKFFSKVRLLEKKK